MFLVIVGGFIVKKNSFLNIPDENIATLAAAGDNNAMDFLLEKHRNMVRAIARGFFLFGGDNDDVLQEGMIGLFKAIRDFDAEKNVSFIAFSRLCIKRQIITAVKTANRNKNKPLNNALSLEQSDFSVQSPFWVGADENPESIIIEQESISFITHQVSDKLSTFEQKVLSLYLGGKTYSEISRELNKEPKSIDNAIQRIKRKLAQLV